MLVDSLALLLVCHLKWNVVLLLRVCCSQTCIEMDNPAFESELEGPESEPEPEPETKTAGTRFT